MATRRFTAEPPVKNVVDDWGQRLQTLVAAGAKPKQIKKVIPIIKQDFRSVKSGGQGMSQTEALLSMASAIKGRPVLTPKDEGGWSPVDLLGDVTSDIKDITWSAIPGLAKFAINLPEEIAMAAQVMSKGTGRRDRRWLRRHGYEPNFAPTLENLTDPSKWAAEIRNVSKTPIFNLVPGVHTAAQSTTEKGRQELLRHPVFTALDVLPVASAAGKLATAGAVSEAEVVAARTAARTAAKDAASEAGVASKAAKAAARTAPDSEAAATLAARAQQAKDAARAATKVATDMNTMRGYAPKSITEALRQGHPYKAGVRAAIPRSVRTALGTKTSNVLQAAGLGKDIFGLARGFQSASRRSAREVKEFSERLAPIQKVVNEMDDEERAVLYDEATNPAAHPDITPAHQAVIDEIRGINELIVENNPDKFYTVTRNKRRYVYPVKSRVAKLHRQMLRVQDTLARIQPEQQDLIASRANLVKDRINRKIATADDLLAKAEARLRAAQEKVTLRQSRAARSNRSIPPFERSLNRVESLSREVERRRATLNDLHTARATFRDTDVVIQSRRARIAKARGLLEETEKRFSEEFRNEPPATFHPMVEKRARTRAADIVADELNVDPEAAANAVTMLERGDLHGLLSPEDWNAIRQETMATWQQMADEGLEPVWVHNVEPELAERPLVARPLPNRNAKISQVKERVGDLTPHVQDVAIALSRAGEEYIRDSITRQFINDFLIPHVRTWDAIRTELHRDVDLMRAKGEIPRGVGEDGALQIALRKRYREWDPDALFPQTKPRITGTATAGGTKLYIERNLMDDAERVALPHVSMNPAIRASRKATSIFKTSVMSFSLKHMAHISFGGTMFLTLRGGLEEWFNVNKAIKMVREGKMPEGLSRDLDVMTADQLWQTAQGGTLGRLWKQAGPGKLAERIYKWDEFVTNVQRTMSYLGEESRALKGGATKAEAIETGLNHAYKALVDLDGLAPIERTIIRDVFPFYSYMRHTLRYILSYPVDHPLRAAILARMASIEQKDFNSGLPQQFQSLFFLGSPDEEGNITGVEMRQWNPFRDAGSWFTIQGFIQSLNPAIGSIAQIAGINQFTGSPDLYQEVTYDPKTGSLVAKRPPNAPYTALQAFIPEVGLIDHFFTVTDDMRKLKARDPDAYKERLWSLLFLPFEPKTVNVGEEAARMQRNQLAIAQQDVSRALQTGDTSGLKRYKLVPFQGQLVPPSVLSAIIDATNTSGGMAPRAVLPSSILEQIQQMSSSARKR